MAFDAGTAEGELTLNTTGFVASLEKAKGAVSDFVSDAASKGGEFALKGLTAAAGAAAAAATVLATAVGFGSVKQAEAEKSLVGLTNVLRAQGVPAYKAVSEEINAFATAMQRSTGIAAESTIDIVKQLAAVGVETKNLKSAAQTVLDFSAAFGINATTAARAFGLALNGNAGLLGRYIPEVKKLTKEQLAAGDAFKVATAAVNGQAEALGNTFGGRVSRLVQSVEDLLERFGAAFNEAFGPLATEIQGVVDLVTDSLAEGSTGFTLFQTAAQGAADAVKASFGFVLGLAANFLELRAAGLETFAAIQGGLAFVGTAVNSLDVALTTAVQNMATSIANFLAALGLVKDAAVFSQLAADAATLVAQIHQAEQGSQALVEAAKATAAEARKSADAAGNLAVQVKSANQAGKSLADQVRIVANNFGIATAAANGTAAATNRASAATTAAVSRAQAMVDIWKNVNQAAENTKGAVDGVTASTQSAAAAADDLASSFDDAAASAGAAGAAAAGAGGGGGSFSAQLGRQGSTRSLDFSDPFSAFAQAQQAVADLQRISGGGGRADIGTLAPVRAARQFADGVVSSANASIDRAIAEFTSQILAELNAQGVTDPTTRSRIVRERIAEARRFGILPPEIQYQPRTF